jgi:hypothetical protein
LLLPVMATFTAVPPSIAMASVPVLKVSVVAA